jgi:hypothetical protein
MHVDSDSQMTPSSTTKGSVWEKNHMILSDKKEAILKRWLDRIVDSYPAEAAKLLKNNPDPFANPLGQTIAREIEPLFNQLLGEELDEQALRSHLDGIVRIRAVQEFSASEAVAFVFGLKAVVREVLGETADRNELLDLEARIDRMALLAFDVYMGCREKIWELKASELKKRADLLLERVNKIYGKLDEQ